MRCSGCCVGEVGTMELSLPLLPPTPYCSGLEDDSDDIPPSPTPDPTTTTLTSGIFFQRGFWDCAQEALRFLTDEEGLAEDSPVVVSLKQHLVDSTQRFTPASLAPSTCSIFTYPTRPSDGGAIDTRHKPGTHNCSTSVRSSNVRFAPYTVTSHCGVSGQYPSTEANKCSSASSHKNGSLNSLDSVLAQRDSLVQSVRTQPTPAPTSRASLQRVLKDDLISAEDLNGVLNCLQFAQSTFVQPHGCVLPPSTPLSTPTSASMQHSSTPFSTPTVQPLTLSSAAMCLQSSPAFRPSVTASQSSVSSSFNDSGVSEPDSADLTDEVDGVQDIVADDVFDSGDRSQTVTSSSCPISLEAFPLSAASGTSSDAVPDSCPSSQLSLLASLSSGTHRLTTPSGEGSATASKIQSLANQILLLLEEEAAEAGDESDSDDDDDDDDDDDEEEEEEGFENSMSSDDELNEEESTVEVEP